MALTEKGINAIRNYVKELGARGAGLKIINILLGKMGLSTDMLPDTAELMNGLDEIEDLLGSGQYDEALTVAKETGRNMLEDEGFPGMRENKEIKENKKIKTKKMKKVTFKKEFANLNEALTKVPAQLREDKNTFEMTDGNKTYQMRWEGTLEEGKAVALQAEDKSLMNEDMQKMKHLWGYKSENTLGKVTAEKRVDENQTFKTLMGKVTNDSEKKKD